MGGIVMKREPSAPGTARSADGGEAVPAYPEKLREAERRLLEERDPANRAGTGWPWAGRLGLSLSGGGIRSATFSLGILQALAGAPWARKGNGEAQARRTPFDVMSTVSGGGYVGSFLGGLFMARKAKEGLKLDPEGSRSGQGWARVAALLRDPHSPPLRFLRENGRYLTPGGSGDGLLAAGVMVRNFLALHLVLGVFALLVFLVLDLAMVGAAGASPALGSFIRACLRAGGGWSLSPWAAFPVLVALGMVLPVGWAYWLVGKGRRAALALPPWVTVVGLGLASAALLAWSRLGHPPAPLLEALSPGGPGFLLFVAVESGLTLAWMVPVLLLARGHAGAAGMAEEAGELSPRRRLTVLLRMSLILLLAGLLLTAVDSAAITIYRWEVRPGRLHWSFHAGAFVAVLAGLASGARRIAEFFGTDLKEGARQARLHWRALMVLLAAALSGSLLVAWAVVAKGMGFGWGHLLSPDGRFLRLGCCATAALVLSVLFGRTFEFLNQSTLGPFYTSMLTRAYLGASNEVRQAQVVSAPYVVAGDDLAWRDYAPHAHGGPLHLVNVCLNETHGGESQTIQRDRKGMALALGPAGVSVGVRHHAGWSQDALDEGQGSAFGVFLGQGPGVPFRPEELTVGRWMGISGAAVSPGMGQRTARAFSLLCGAFNARLGYWWDGGVPPARRYGQSGLASWAVRPFRFLFAVQFHLLDEFLAHFPGTATRHWYLSDGGHFENLGLYELIRRRLPFLIAVDAGADPDTGLGDLENLVRLARVDFGTDVRFLSEGELRGLGLGPLVDEGALGPLDGLRRGRWEGTSLEEASRRGFSRCHAALARLAYPADGAGAPTQGWMLYIKPTLLQPRGDSGDLPLDVYAYHDQHPDFPHESTGDQFFPEAQWESYRSLGEHIGHRLLGPQPGGGRGLLWERILAIDPEPPPAG